MDSTLVVRGRTASVRTEILVLEAQNRCLQPEIDPSQDVTPLFLRLMPFERKLLECLSQSLMTPETIKNVETGHSLDGLVAKLFFQWQWTSDVMHQVLTDLHPQEIEDDHNGDQDEAFEMVQTMLRVAKNGDFMDLRYQRTEQFVRDNQPFVNKLGAIDVSKIDFYPHPQDKELWRLLAHMYAEEIGTVSNWAGFREDYDLDDTVEADDLVAEADTVDAQIQDFAQSTTQLSNRSMTQFQSGDEVGLPSLYRKDLEASQLRMTGTGEPTSRSSEQGQSTSSPTRAEKMTEIASQRAEALLKLENTWTVWQFSRTFWLLKSRPNNDAEIVEFTRLAHFTDHWKVVEIAVDDAAEDDDEGSVLRGYLAKEEFQGEMLVS